MNNQNIAAILYKLADLLEAQAVEWKPQAYRKAARSLEFLKKGVSDIYKKGGVKALDDIPGVGAGIAKKIEQYLKTGKINAYERLRKSAKGDLSKLTDIISMGPRRAALLHRKLGITTLKELEKAAKAGKIAKLPTFGEKSQQDILESIKFHKQKSGRVPLKDVLPLANRIKRHMLDLKETERFEIAGSIRRKKPMIRDIDLLAISKKPEVLMDAFTTMAGIQKVLAKGSTKAMVILKNGMQADLRVVPPKSFGGALQYFTGDIPHNISLRKIAIKKGYKLNEYGLFDRKTGKLVAGKKEEDIYKKLGVKFISPEKRVGAKSVILEK